jgi:hypothetical protein
MQTETLPLALANPYKIGDGVTLCGYSDRSAYTVIAVTAKTITIQRDKATLLNGYESGEKDALQFFPGGFVGHTTGAQRYSYERDENGHVVKCFMRKRPKMVWTPGAGENGRSADVPHADFRQGSSRVIPGRHEHYDFNF